MHNVTTCAPLTSFYQTRLFRLSMYPSVIASTREVFGHKLEVPGLVLHNFGVLDVKVLKIIVCRR
jgi:hypothetical protein